MKKQFNYLFKEKTAFFYRGKNDVIEIEFDSQKEANLFQKDFIEFENNNFQDSNNQDIIDFWAKNRFFLQNDFKKSITKKISLIGLNDIQKEFLEPLLIERGFKNFVFDDKEREFIVLVNDFTLYKELLEKKIEIVTVDLNQGYYATIGPHYIPNETACYRCMQKRFKINNLLEDFFDSSQYEIEEYLQDDIFEKEVLVSLIQYLYLEFSSINRGVLHNRVINFSFLSQSKTEEVVLPFPNCLCQE